MLIRDNVEAFNDPNYIFELKLDGIRCLAYVGDGKTELINKRDKKLTTIFPELANMHKQVKGKCILDGELFILKEGKPNFEQAQKRALMTNRFKIELEQKAYPASFAVFDLLYYRGKDISKNPLIDRKEKLEKSVTESDHLAISRYIWENGIDFFAAAKQQQLEGIVGKHKDSKYYFDKRTTDWLKIKYLQDDDFVICGYLLKKEWGKTLVLGQYSSQNELIYKGHVSGISSTIFEKILAVPKTECPFPHEIPNSNQEATWIEPELVCKVEYMHLTKSGGMRQPTFRGLRDDKDPKDCIENKKPPA